MFICRGSSGEAAEEAAMGNKCREGHAPELTLALHSSRAMKGKRKDPDERVKRAPRHGVKWRRGVMEEGCLKQERRESVLTYIFARLFPCLFISCFFCIVIALFSTSGMLLF